MTVAPPDTSTKYDLDFAKWVYENIEGGDKLALCMQCGVCSGSCPIGVQMDYGPRKLFMMIRAGMKEEVMTSSTQWNCTSCYRCVVRCPRSVPVTYILQDLAAKSAELGYAQKTNENVNFARSFWWSAKTFGRTDERLVTALYYFSFGLKEGYQRGLANLKIALNFVKRGRMHIGLPHRIKGRRQLKAILAKAEEIAKREGLH
ncbi:MAG: 4Fe-4S dicluster domain-containing protein [Hyphomicrobiaceae bacterium]|nr:MAG: 4Fe-4S dicluster domain-containing protein [Hyphomicrobiaceae bacterium]